MLQLHCKSIFAKPVKLIPPNKNKVSFQLAFLVSHPSNILLGIGRAAEIRNASATKNKPSVPLPFLKISHILLFPSTV
jgi:hypothetical protein